MAIIHPVASENEKDVSLSKNRLEKVVNKLQALVDSDIQSRKGHEQKLAKYYRRRYQLTGRNPQFPWPGSSNIIMPVIDMEIDKAKSPLMNVFNSDPIVTFTPMQVISAGKQEAAEQAMQWLLKVRMRDFFKNMEIAADHLKTFGYSIVKTIYEYKTRIITEVIKKEEISPEDKQQIAEAQAAVLNGIASQEDFDEVFSEFIIDQFGLDTDDKIDQKAAEDIMNFILDDKDEVTIKRKETIFDAPFSYTVDPALFVPESGVMDIQDAERIVEIQFVSENDLRIRAKDGYFDKDAVNRIIKRLQEKDIGEDSVGSISERFTAELESEKADREGLTFTNKESLIEIREAYFLHDIDGDGVKEKVLMIYAPDSNEVLRFMEFPYEHGLWPYVQIRNEDADPRFYSPRGIPELIDQIDDLITQNHRDKINRNRIANSPTFKYRLGSNINPNNFQWVPGQFYPVMNMNDFEPVQIQHIDGVFDNEENILSLWVERRLGSIELALRSQSGSEARTRQEILAVQSIGQQALTMSITRWQRGLKKIYHQIWSLWMQYGPNEFIVSQSSNQIRRISRHEIQGQFEMIPTGTLGESNPEQQFIRSQTRLQLLMQLQQAGFLGLLGDEFEINFGEAFLDMMNKDDFIAGNRIIRRRTQEEINQIRQQREMQNQQEQQFQQSEQDIQENRPVPITDLQATLKEMERRSPNKGAQQVAF